MIIINSQNTYHDEARIQEARLQRTLLNFFKDLVTELKEIATTKLADVEERILADFNIGDRLTKEQKQDVDNVTDLLKTGASREGQEILKRGRRYLREVLNPNPLLRLTHPLRIQRAFLIYRNCLEEAISRSTIVWFSWFGPQFNQTYKKRIEPKIQQLETTLSELKSST